MVQQGPLHSRIRPPRGKPGRPESHPEAPACPSFRRTSRAQSHRSNRFGLTAVQARVPHPLNLGLPRCTSGNLAALVEGGIGHGTSGCGASRPFQHFVDHFRGDWIRLFPGAEPGGSRAAADGRIRIALGRCHAAIVRVSGDGAGQSSGDGGMWRDRLRVGLHALCVR